MSSAGWVFAHYPYIEDLVEATPDDLLRLGNVGLSGVVNTQIGLTCIGLSLKGFEWQISFTRSGEPCVVIDPNCLSEAMRVKYERDIFQHRAPSNIVDLVRSQEAARRALEDETGRED
jgi:hypothetical protein